MISIIGVVDLAPFIFVTMLQYIAAVYCDVERSSHASEIRLRSYVT